MHRDELHHGGTPDGLRVLVVNPDLPRRDGDPRATRLFQLLELLVHDGHHVALLACAGAGQELLAAELVALGIDVFPVDRAQMRERGARIGGPDLDHAALLRSGRFDLAWIASDAAPEHHLRSIRSLSPLTRLIVDPVDGTELEPAISDAADALVTLTAVDRGSLRELLSTAARTPFVTVAGAPGVARAIDAFATGFSPRDPVSLILTVPADDPDAAAAAFADAARILVQSGRDPDHVADIQICPVREDVILPGRAVIVGGEPGSRSVGPQEPPARWRELARLAPVTPRSVRRRRVPRAAILLHAPDDPAAVAPQLSALRCADLPDDVEVVIAADPAGERMETLLRSASDVRIVRVSMPLGRHHAWQVAAHATDAPFAIALSPLSIPAAGFVDPLIDLIDRGAALAAPVVDGAAGLRVAADGSLWPRAAADEIGLDALPLDCLASRADLFRDGLPTFARGEGHVETQLAGWASQHGPMAVSGSARVERLAAPDASVIICTRNRVQELPDCVALVLAAGARDVVIVDNDSTDATAEVAEELARRSEGIVHLVHEPRGGICHARTAGAAAARHDLLIYIDDDARVAPGWLHHMARTLTRPGVANAGGPISALWPRERPSGWPGRDLEALLSVLDLGDGERTLVPPDVVYGANWGVRRDALVAAGGFDPRFGYGPEMRVGGDEVSIAWRLHAGGIGASMYVPGAAVGHRIAVERIDDGYLLSRGLGVGVERPRHAHALGDAGRDRLTASAKAAAGALLGAHPLRGDLTVAAALDQIAAAPGTLTHRVGAAVALGELGGAVALLGEHRVVLGDLLLWIDVDSLLRGVVAPAAAPPT